MSTNTLIITFCLLFGAYTRCDGLDSEQFEAFIWGIITTWQLRSPTILFKDDLPQMCMNQQWILCLTLNMDTNELANHLAFIHKHRKQDGLIFVGHQSHEKLLKHMSEIMPSIFTSLGVFGQLSKRKHHHFRALSQVSKFY